MKQCKHWGSAWPDQALCGCCDLLQSHASYSRCGLGSHGTDRLVALVREEAAAALAEGRAPALYGAKITGGGSGGASVLISSACLAGHAWATVLELS